MELSLWMETGPWLLRPTVPPSLSPASPAAWVMGVCLVCTLYEVVSL